MQPKCCEHGLNKWVTALTIAELFWPKLTPQGHLRSDPQQLSLSCITKEQDMKMEKEPKLLEAPSSKVSFPNEVCMTQLKRKYREGPRNPKDIRWIRGMICRNKGRQKETFAPQEFISLQGWKQQKGERGPQLFWEVPPRQCLPFAHLEFALLSSFGRYPRGCTWGRSFYLQACRRHEWPSREDYYRIEKG